MSGAGARALGRNVFFHDIRHPDTILGGLILSNGVTKANFYQMVEIVLIISEDYFLQNPEGEKVLRNVDPLLPGNYYVVTDGTVEVLYLFLSFLIASFPPLISLTRGYFG